MVCHTLASLKLRRALSSCVCFGWILFHHSKISASILQMTSPFMNCRQSFFFCFESSSSELSIDVLCCHFFKMATDDFDGAAADGDASVDIVVAAAPVAITEVAG